MPARPPRPASAQPTAAGRGRSTPSRATPCKTEAGSTRPRLPQGQARCPLAPAHSGATVALPRGDAPEDTGTNVDGHLVRPHTGQPLAARTCTAIARRLVLCLLLCLPPAAPHAQSDGAEPYGGLRLSLPYAFYNETFGLTGGWVEGRVGYPQPQARILGTVMAGSEGSQLGFVMAQDLRIPGMDRLFIDPMLSLGRYGSADAYIDGNPAFAGQRAGTNTSDSDNFVTGNVDDTFSRVRFRYLLPIGHGRDQVIPEYEVRDGLLVSGATGGTSLNPLESGRSFVAIRPFQRSLDIDSDDFTGDIRTNGVDLIFFWDNRDFPYNPSDGNGVRLQVSRDFGFFDSSDSWTVVQAEVDAYHDFGSTGRFRNRILAFDLWTADTPSWTDDGGTIRNRAPAYTGATLGGLWRMRGYPAQRFNDRSAIYYSAEMRLTPRWNPFDAWPAAQNLLGVEWIQVVPFLEVGRVHDSYDLAELHTDMKWNAGAGLRAWVKGFVVRADTAFSDEGVRVQMMIAQPFQF